MPSRKSSNRKTSEQRVARVRNSILGGVAAIAILVAGYGMLYSSGVTQGEFIEGDHYQVLDNPVRRRPGEPIKVQEFFSYTCIHCKNFDPLIEQWQLNQSSDTVTFSRSPVIFSPTWTTLGKTYHTLVKLGILEANHSRVFRQIHDNRQEFNSADEMADFIDGNGASKQEFLEAFNSPDVRRAMRDSDVAQRATSIRTIPTLLVAGKYTITMNNGRQTALEVLDHLIDLEHDTEPE